MLTVYIRSIFKLPSIALRLKTIQAKVVQSKSLTGGDFQHLGIRPPIEYKSKTKKTTLGIYLLSVYSLLR
jgi:hypothetical protein